MCLRAISAWRTNALFESDKNDLDEAQVSSILALEFPLQPAKRKRAEFLLFGDRKRSDPAERRRAIWEAHPENKVFFANYATCLLNNRTDSPSDFDLFQRDSTKLPDKYTLNFELRGNDSHLELPSIPRWNSRSSGRRCSAG